jgi:hypothetical protein
MYREKGRGKSGLLHLQSLKYARNSTSIKKQNKNPNLQRKEA